MHEPTPEMIEMYTILALGVAAVGLGLPGLLVRRRAAERRSHWRPALGVALVLGLAGAALAASGLPRYVWMPPLALAPVWLLFALLRAGAFAPLSRCVSAALSQPRGQAAVAVLAGGALLSWQTYALTWQVENQFNETEAFLALITSVPPLEENPELCGLTDAGKPIPLWRPVEGFTDRDICVEEEYLRKQGYETKLIRTALPDLSHNCHGWVFTGGKAWIRGAHVDQILLDNHYQVVSQPAPGDVAIYRTSEGVVSHTALVRSVTEDGIILVEGKWGKLGRFIHTASDHVYAQATCTYYRSPRGSHVIRLSKDL